MTLTSALTTLSSEKNRIELSFQNDKKRLLAEKEKVLAMLKMVHFLSFSLFVSFSLFENMHDTNSFVIYSTIINCQIVNL